MRKYELTYSFTKVVKKDKMLVVYNFYLILCLVQNMQAAIKYKTNDFQVNDKLSNLTVFFYTYHLMFL